VLFFRLEVDQDHRSNVINFIRFLKVYCVRDYYRGRKADTVPAISTLWSVNLEILSRSPSRRKSQAMTEAYCSNTRSINTASATATHIENDCCKTVDVVTHTPKNVESRMVKLYCV